MTSASDYSAWPHALLAALFLLAVPSAAWAGLYKYKRSDGTVLLTNEPRPDLELVAVLSGAPPNASSSNDGGGSSSSAPSDEAGASATPSTEGLDLAEGEDPSPPHPTARENRFDDLIREAARAYDVPFSFIKGVIHVESHFQPNVTSHAGAMGLMQLMPATARQMNVTRPFDPRQNVFGGTKLLRKLIDRYDGDINLVLSAYHAGGGAVDEYGGIPYRKTRRYVASVYRWYQHYSDKREGEE